MEKRRILFIDDEAQFIRLIKLNPEQLGRYEVRAVSRSGQGEEAAREFQPHLIFLDVMMPEMDGGELAARIRANSSTKHIPIVFLTAVVSKEEAVSKAGLIGGYPFLAKPVTIDQIVESINVHSGRQ